MMDQSVEQLFDEGTKIIKSVLMKTKFNKMNKKAVIIRTILKHLTNLK